MSNETARRPGRLVKIDASNGVEMVYHPPGSVYSCEVHLSASPGGGFAATVARMPDLTAAGGSEDEAKNAIRERLAVWLKAQKVAGSVRWADQKREPQPGELVRVLTVEIG